MNITQFNTLEQKHNFDYAIKKLAKQEKIITSKKQLIRYTKQQIDKEYYMLANKILRAIDEDNTNYYIYNYNKGRIATPQGIRTFEDIKHFLDN